jgi:ketosteroid isomerase-like protein
MGISMVELDKSIAQVIENYKSAVFAKNVDKLMPIYDQNVRVFDAWGVWCYEGSDAWRLAAEGWLNSLGTERVKVTFEDVQGTMVRECAFVSAIVTYAAIDEAGVQLRSMQNRLTWMLKLGGHNLRIVHEHTSAPIGFEDMKAILQR